MDGVRPSRPDKPYQRTYKACIPCRQRKAKCDLGTDPDGLPIGPPCARCRRELRECVFPEKRAWERSRKRGGLEYNTEHVYHLLIADWPVLGRSPESYEPDTSPRHVRQLTETSPEDSIRPPGRTNYSRRTSDLSNPAPETNNFHQSPNLQSGWSYTNGISPSHNGALGQNGAAEPLQSSSHTYENTKHRSNSSLSSSMMRTVVASGNDALNILFEAATAQEESHTDTSPESGTGAPSTGPSQHQTPGNYDAAFEPVTRIIRPVQLSHAAQDTLNVWEACRFVKMGWFTAREAVTFVDLSVPRF